MTGSGCAIKLEKRFTFYRFFENKVHFYPIILVNTKPTLPPQGRCLGLDIYLGIYPTLFTSPLGIVVTYSAISKYKI